MLLALVLTAAAAVPPDPADFANRVVHTAKGNLCPISASVAVTAAHVIDDMRKSGDFRWQSESGIVRGLVRVITYDAKLDVALVAVESGDQFPMWSDLAKDKLRSGDPVLLVGVAAYVLDKEETGVLHGWYVGRQDNGMLVIDSSGYPGFSGGCLLDRWGRVHGTLSSIVGTGPVPTRPVMWAAPVPR
jgi:hypothetical protein